MVRKEALLFAAVSLLEMTGAVAVAQRSTPFCEKPPVFGPYDAKWGNSSFGVWLGADAAFSVVLKESDPRGNLSQDRASGISSPVDSSIKGQKILWVFGDTFLGKGGSRTRQGSQMLGNTIGIADCSGRITYNWWDIPPKAKAFFKDPGPGLRYWPGQPFMAGKVLYVPLQKVQAIATEFGFKIVGTDIAVIPNALDTLPNKWEVRILPLFKTPSMSGAHAAVVSGGYVYLFNVVGSRGTVLTRLRTSILAAARPALESYVEYLDESGVWTKGFEPGKAKSLGLTMNSGATLGYDPTKKVWRAIYADSSSFPFKRVVLSESKRLEGPWSTPSALFDIPAKGGDGTFCYAAYGHREYNPSPDDKVLFTYNCNNVKLSETVRSLGIYFPRWVSAPVVQSAEAAPPLSLSASRGIPDVDAGGPVDRTPAAAEPSLAAAW